MAEKWLLHLKETQPETYPKSLRMFAENDDQWLYYRQRILDIVKDCKTFDDLIKYINKNLDKWVVCNQFFIGFFVVIETTLLTGSGEEELWLHHSSFGCSA